MRRTNMVAPFSLKDAPALIEHILPAQRLSLESYKEQMAVQSKTLTTLGSYWKGRKPLILSKACVLGCLLPATDDLAKDLEIFELLMGMDPISIAKRLKLKPGEQIPPKSYRDLISSAKRPEELQDALEAHIWPRVNVHLGTMAQSMPELVEQLGIMRFGHRPKMADTFCGSGQIPFEAARLGCDVYASDLNPVASMLTWGALNIVGGSSESRAKLSASQRDLVRQVQDEIDELGVETDGDGWRPKALLYCVETRCPQTGWSVPLLPTRIVSASRNAIAELVPDNTNHRYDIHIRIGVTAAEMKAAETGTIGRDGKYGEAHLIHEVNGVPFKTKVTTLRGDYQAANGSIANRLRLWEKCDFMPRPEDILQERLYCIQWVRPQAKGKGAESSFRSVTEDDLQRERMIQTYVAQHLEDWQDRGWVPDMRIEVGSPPRYQGLDLVRARGWTHWHHVFAPRQLLFLGLINKYIHESGSCHAPLSLLLARLTDWSSKLCIYGSGAARESISHTFYNQALNTLFSYGVRPFAFAQKYLLEDFARSAVAGVAEVDSRPSGEVVVKADLCITDPPYGDAVKYEEILDFFIGWLRKSPPPEFANWVWDSRRALAIKGEGEDFRRGMVAAYKCMGESIPDNGIQVIMFTHQSGSIWADMANIVWASGLRVTAAWYVVTETDSALRGGSNVKGTVLLVVRKRVGSLRTTRDDLAWDIKDEVESQVATLTGLNQRARPGYRDENLFGDADLQMAGYAAALRVLTKYSVIDGNDMVSEAIRPRVKGAKTVVDELIEFAVSVANQTLVPLGIERSHWERLKPAERFYLKLLELENQGFKTLDNYQNFAKAFKVADFKPLMGGQKANAARLKSAVELGRSEMGVGSEFASTLLRPVLYAVMELVKGIDGTDVLTHLSFNVEGFYDSTVRATLVELIDYLGSKLTELRPEEASAARVLGQLIKNQRV